MTQDGAPLPEQSIADVVEAARKLGVELDEAEAAEWISAISSDAGGSLVVDVDTGVYGHRISMADVDEAGMARFRRMAGIVGFLIARHRW